MAAGLFPLYNSTSSIMSSLPSYPNIGLTEPFIADEPANDISPQFYTAKLPSVFIKVPSSILSTPKFTMGIVSDVIVSCSIDRSP